MAARKELKIRYPVQEGESGVSLGEADLLAALGTLRRKKWPRFVVGIPKERTLREIAVDGFMAIAAQGIDFLRQPYTRVDIARNRYANAMLAAGDTWTHLVMLDSDHVHPADILQRFEADLLAYPQIKVLGGLNFRRGPAYDPCAFGITPEGETFSLLSWEPGIMRVDVLGSGSIVIAKEIFEQLPYPWFGYDYAHADRDEWPGTDIWFSNLCRAHGIEQYVDTRITSPHIGDLMVDEQVFRTYLKYHPGLAEGAEEAVADTPEAALSTEDRDGPNEMEWLRDRHKAIHEVAPELFSGPAKKVLYVGANKHRFQMGNEIAEAGHEITVLEIWPPYADELRDDWRVKHMVVGDVRRLDEIELPEAGYDIAVWWHGPEHVDEKDVATAMRQLERRVKPGGLVVAGCPWGRFWQPAIDGNEAQEHKSHLLPDAFAGQGYAVRTAGVVDTHYSSIIAWKRIDT